MFCYDQEPLLPEYNYELFQRAKRIRDDDGVRRPVILLNTERHSQAKNQILKEWGFVDCYYFFHIFAAADWFRGYQYCPGLVSPAERTVRKKFIAFNRITGNSRVYRSFFVAELQQQGLLDHGHISYSDRCPVHNNSYRDNIQDAVVKHGVSAEYAEQCILSLDQIPFPLRIDHKTNSSIPNGSPTLSAIDECMESFLYVVTETCFWEDKEHLTEKIFKPIVSRQPFVLLGCANNLQYLRDYGFRTFDQWWDESYDNIEDPVERLQAVVQIVKDICSRSDQELEQMLVEMTEVLEYNYQRFYSKDLLDQAWQELTTNLQQAVAQLPRPTVPET